MLRQGLLLLAGLLLTAAQVSAADPARNEEQGTFLGALFGPVPEALAAQLPHLPPDRGVLVTHVLPDSPAARAGLRRHDLLLRYGSADIRDCEHLARLIQRDRAGRVVPLLLLRGGRETTVPVTLGLGPVLRLARSRQASALPERAAAREGLPPPVSVAATPLANGAMKVTVEYYRADTGRRHTLTCQGDRSVIDEAVRKLPERQRGLVRTALQRIRDLDSHKSAGKP